MKFFFFKGLIFSHLFMSEVINRVVKSFSLCRRDRGSLLLHTSGFRVQIPLDLEWWNLTSRVPHYRFQSLEVHVLPAKTQAFPTTGETALTGKLSFCGSRQEKGPPPPASSFLFRGALLCPLEGGLEPEPSMKLWWPLSVLADDRVFEDHHLFHLPWAVAISFFFFFPAWFLSATAGGYPAVGFPAATFTDAAVTAATPPVFAAPGPSNHPARAARPSPPTSHSR